MPIFTDRHLASAVEAFLGRIQAMVRSWKFFNRINRIDLRIGSDGTVFPNHLPCRGSA